MRFTGVRIGDAVGLDVDNLPTTQRRRRLRIRGKGRKTRSVPVHGELTTARRTWPGAADNPAVFLNRACGRLSLRAADEVIGAIAAAAGLADVVRPHVLRRQSGTDLIRAGVDVVTVAELLGHASLDSTRIYTNPRELHQTGEFLQFAC